MLLHKENDLFKIYVCCHHFQKSFVTFTIISKFIRKTVFYDRVLQ